MRPLAERMRPDTPDDYIGQDHLMGKDAYFRQMLENGNLHAMLFWGPPGVGKTTLARLIASYTKREFFELSAISAGVKELREIIQYSKEKELAPVLFIDEVHRFNKAQQDALLGAVEKGTIILVGATTENPSFEVISALLSRCRVYILNPLRDEDLDKMLNKAVLKDNILKHYSIQLNNTTALKAMSGGDGRKLFNALEIVVQAQSSKQIIIIDNDIVMQILQENLAIYDKNGEMHYDIISAFIKAVRGSDPDAATYYLARMLDAGENIEFIARRLIILSAEDIGLANPNALLLSTQCFEAIRYIGMPEARIILAQTTIYLSTSPKSNSAYLAIDKALAYVKQNPYEPVPIHLRNAPTNLMKKLDYGKNYKYPHDFPNNYVKQDYMPESASNLKFYIPGNNSAELSAGERLKKWQTPKE
jgi:putative ATPase